MYVTYIWLPIGTYHMELRTYPRRIQVIGKKTYAVTLPKRWVSSHNLDKGSLVLLVERDDGTLVVVPGGKTYPEVKAKAVLHASFGEEAELERNVIALYEAGYDVIRVVVKPRVTRQFLRVLKKVLARLSGVEVAEEGEDYVLLQVVLDPRRVGFDRVLGRMEVLLRASLSDLLEYAEKGTREALKALVERDDEVDKCHFLLNRQASLVVRRPELARDLGLESLVELIPILYYGKTLERMADTLTQLAMYLLEFAAPLDVSLVKTMRRGLKWAILAFRDEDQSAAKSLAREYSKYFSKTTREVLSDPRNYLVGNFLSLCLDVVEAYVELVATRIPSV